MQAYAFTSAREVTASEYAEFLNHIAAADPDHLFDESMATDPEAACIVRLGTPGKYFYEVIEGRESFPVCYVNEVDEEKYMSRLSSPLHIMCYGAATADGDPYLKSSQSSFAVDGSQESQMLSLVDNPNTGSSSASFFENHEAAIGIGIGLLSLFAAHQIWRGCSSSAPDGVMESTDAAEANERTRLLLSRRPVDQRNDIAQSAQRASEGFTPTGNELRRQALDFVRLHWLDASNYKENDTKGLIERDYMRDLLKPHSDIRKHLALSMIAREKRIHEQVNALRASLGNNHQQQKIKDLFFEAAEKASNAAVKIKEWYDNDGEEVHNNCYTRSRIEAINKKNIKNLMYGSFCLENQGRALLRSDNTNADSWKYARELVDEEKFSRAERIAIKTKNKEKLETFRISSQTATQEGNYPVAHYYQWKMKDLSADLRKGLTWCNYFSCIKEECLAGGEAVKYLAFGSVVLSPVLLSVMIYPYRPGMQIRPFWSKILDLNQKKSSIKGDLEVTAITFSLSFIINVCIFSFAIV